MTGQQFSRRFRSFKNQGELTAAPAQAEYMTGDFPSSFGLSAAEL